MKLLKRILILVLVVIVGLAAARNVLIRKGAVKAIEVYTGFGLEFTSVNVGIFSPVVELRGVRLLNPADFPEETAFEIEEFYIEYDPSSLLSDRLVIRELVLDIPLAVVVRKVDGESNVERLADSGRKKSGKRRHEKEEPRDEPGGGKAEKSAPSIVIEEMTVKLGTLEIHKYKPDRSEPRVEKYELNTKQTFHDVTSLKRVMDQLMINVAADELSKGLKDLAEENEDSLEKIGLKKEDVEKVGEKLKGFLKGL